MSMVERTLAIVGSIVAILALAYRMYLQNKRYSAILKQMAVVIPLLQITGFTLAAIVFNGFTQAYDMEDVCQHAQTLTIEELYGPTPCTTNAYVNTITHLPYTYLAALVALIYAVLKLLTSKNVKNVPEKILAATLLVITPTALIGTAEQIFGDNAVWLLGAIIASVYVMGFATSVLKNARDGNKKRPYVWKGVKDCNLLLNTTKNIEDCTIIANQMYVDNIPELRKSTTFEGVIRAILKDVGSIGFWQAAYLYDGEHYDEIVRKLTQTAKRKKDTMFCVVVAKYHDDFDGKDYAVVLDNSEDLRIRWRYIKPIKNVVQVPGGKDIIGELNK